MKMNSIKIYFLACCGAALLTGCYKETLPVEKDYMSKDTELQEKKRLWPISGV